MDEIVMAAAPVIDSERLMDFTRTLQKYKAAKARLESRIVASEEWWKLRNDRQTARDGFIHPEAEDFHSVSGWLHNVIVSKHADAMDAYPDPTILPREQGDKAEAQMLSSIIPAVIEQNRFESTYSDVMWQKLKTGTGVYKVMWDTAKLNGLGDIAIERVDLLNLFWTPGVTDIQNAKMVFHTALMDKDEVEQQYPQTRGKLNSNGFVSTKFLYDDTVDTSDKVTVIEVYYKKPVGGKRLLHYCKYVGDVLLYATENEVLPPTVEVVGPDGLVDQLPLGRAMSETGLYDHGQYPFVFDTLFPVEGSPCGYGFVDLCRNPQMEIDLLKTAFVKNALVGAVPRYFSRADGGVNEDEFLDLNRALVHVDGNLGEDSLRLVEHKSLDGVYVQCLNNTIQELRETSGNTDSATGITSGGVTAASAIAALQEASGKGSRDATQASYRAYARVITLCIELMRQFYDLPRHFRILGEYGADKFVSYSNRNLKLQTLDGGSYRLPEFDIKVSAQKRSAYTKMAQNELAVQFFKLGFFNPQMSDQALMCLGMMDFDGKDELQQKISQNGIMYERLLQYQQMALMLAQQYRPELVQGLAQNITHGLGIPLPAGGGDMSAYKAAASGIANSGERAQVLGSRARVREAAQPDGGRVLASGD